VALHFVAYVPVRCKTSRGVPKVRTEDILESRPRILASLNLGSHRCTAADRLAEADRLADPVCQARMRGQYFGPRAIRPIWPCLTRPIRHSAEPLVKWAM